MKKITIITLMFLLVPTLCFAVDMEALQSEMKSLMALDDVLSEAWTENEAKGTRLEAESASLIKRKDDLEWSGQMVEEATSKWLAKKAVFEGEVAVVTAEISAHNARCAGTFEDEGYVNACNAAADRINGKADVLRSEESYLNSERGRVNELIAGQEEAWTVHNRNVDRWEAEVKAYEKDREELIEAGLKIQGRMKEIMAIFESCDAAIKAYDASPDPMMDGTMERMKAICGQQMFDGS